MNDRLNRRCICVWFCVYICNCMCAYRMYAIQKVFFSFLFSNAFYVVAAIIDVFAGLPLPLIPPSLSFSNHHSVAAACLVDYYYCYWCWMLDYRIHLLAFIRNGFGEKWFFLAFVSSTKLFLCKLLSFIWIEPQDKLFLLKKNSVILCNQIKSKGDKTYCSLTFQCFVSAISFILSRSLVTYPLRTWLSIENFVQTLLILSLFLSAVCFVLSVILLFLRREWEKQTKNERTKKQCWEERARAFTSI